MRTIVTAVAVVALSVGIAYGQSPNAAQGKGHTGAQGTTGKSCAPGQIKKGSACVSADPGGGQGGAAAPGGGASGGGTGTGGEGSYSGGQHYGGGGGSSYQRPSWSAPATSENERSLFRAPTYGYQRAPDHGPTMCRYSGMAGWTYAPCPLPRRHR